MTEEITSFERPVTVRATEVVSRSQGKTSVVRIGFPWKKFHSRSCSTRETRVLQATISTTMEGDKWRRNAHGSQVASNINN